MAQTEPLPLVPATWMTLGVEALASAERPAFDTRNGCEATAGLSNAATTFVQQPPNVFETQFNPEALQTIQPGERLLVIQMCARCHIHRAAAK